MSAPPVSLLVVVVTGSTLAMVLLVLAATWLAGWYEERARRAEAMVRRGARLRPGFGAIHGTAQRLDGNAGGLLVATTTAQVERGGKWYDLDRETTGTPFAIVLPSGEAVEVDPADVVVEGGLPRGRAKRRIRDRVASVSSGDEVWATGVLSAASSAGAGAYRRGPTHRQLRAPRGGSVEIGRESPVPRWRALASAHKVGAYVALGAGAIVHGAVFRKVDAALVQDDLSLVAPLAYGRGGVAWFVLAGLLAVAVAALVWWSNVARARRGFQR
jgi:hypothetical protein